MFIDYVVLITHQTEFSTVVFLWNLYLSRNVAGFTGTVSIKILVVKVKVDWKNFTTSQGVSVSLKVFSVEIVGKLPKSQGEIQNNSRHPTIVNSLSNYRVSFQRMLEFLWFLMRTEMKKAKPFTRPYTYIARFGTFREWSVSQSQQGIVSFNLYTVKMQIIPTDETVTLGLHLYRSAIS